MSIARILVVEDEPITSADIRQGLERLGYSVCGTATSGARAFELAAQHQPDLALVDIRLKGTLDGIDTARSIKEKLGVPVIFLTAHKDPATLQRAKHVEPLGYLLKPFNEHSLRLAIDVGLHKYRTERKVRETKQWLQTTLNCIQDAVIALDASSKVVFLNASAARLIGMHLPSDSRENLCPLPSPPVIPTQGSPINLAELHTQILTSKIALPPIEVCLSRSGPHEEWLEYTASPITDKEENLLGTVFVFRDITDRKRNERERQLFEEQLHQAHRLDAIGKLASGVAHDFNNLLATILGNISMLQQTCDPSQEELLSAMEIACSRASDLARKLLMTSDDNSTPPLPIPVISAIKAAVEITRHSFPAITKITTDFRCTDGTVRGDTNSLHQILFNILINCRDAINEKLESHGKLNGYSPEIVITVSDSTSRGSENRVVEIAVADNGVGMTPEVTSRIFEPFFTTKGPSNGRSGLGLYVVYGLVKKLGGAFDVKSTPNEGTTFSILLPHASEETASFSRPTLTLSRPVLVVGADQLTRDLIKAMAARSGLTAITAPSGEAGLAILEERQAPVATIVYDTAVEDLPLDLFIEKLPEMHANSDVIVLTENDNTPAATKAMVVKKPIQLDRFSELFEGMREAC